MMKTNILLITACTFLTTSPLFGENNKTLPSSDKVETNTTKDADSKIQLPASLDGSTMVVQANMTTATIEFVKGQAPKILEHTDKSEPATAKYEIKGNKILIDIHYTEGDSRIYNYYIDGTNWDAEYEKGNEDVKCKPAVISITKKEGNVYYGTIEGYEGTTNNGGSQKIKNGTVTITFK